MSPTRRPRPGRGRRPQRSHRLTNPDGGIDGGRGGDGQGGGRGGGGMMRAGVGFPKPEFGNDAQAIRDYAQTAEGLGYDYLLVYDHVLGAHPARERKLTGPYTYEHAFREPMVFFGFLAAVTSR